MKHKKIKGIKHLVFSDLNEYYSHFGNKAPVPKKNWREGEEGDWVVADDKGVIQL